MFKIMNEIEHLYTIFLIFLILQKSTIIFKPNVQSKYAWVHTDINK